MRIEAIILAVTLVMAPIVARSADLVVWWDKGYYAQEDEAVREIIAAFEHGTGKQVELVSYSQEELPEKLKAALEIGRPPDFAFGGLLNDYIAEWALNDRLIDLTDTVGPFSNLFDPDALAWWTVPNKRMGQRALYALPMGRNTMHLHVWKSLLEQAGFTLEDIPREWDSFWSFWCDEVQPAVRRATGSDEVWGIGLAMSGDAVDTGTVFEQFRLAYQADYVTRDGRLILDDPDVQDRLIRAIESYTAIYRKGCTPPDSVKWRNRDNNEQFHARAVVLTANNTLSIPNALKRERPKDYYQNTATIAWPLGPGDKPFPIRGSFWPAAIFKDGGHTATAKDFVRFLVAEGWLAHYLDFSGERMLPPMPKLLEQPFWLDPSDPHRMASVMQVASRPMQYDYATVSGNGRYDMIWQERVWEKAIHRVAAEGVSPEQAVNEAIARIKQILRE
jgi:multiple sugar transport system substrate-binding protein